MERFEQKIGGVCLQCIDCGIEVGKGGDQDYFIVQFCSVDFVQLVYVFFVGYGVVENDEIEVMLFKQLICFIDGSGCFDQVVVMLQ